MRDLLDGDLREGRAELVVVGSLGQELAKVLIATSGFRIRGRPVAIAPRAERRSVRRLSYSSALSRE